MGSASTLFRTALIAASAESEEEVEGLLGARHDNGVIENGGQQTWWQRDCLRLSECWTSMCVSCGQMSDNVCNYWRSVCPLSRRWHLSKQAFASLLENAASIGVMAVLTLNIYSATFFLVWAEHDSICLVGEDHTFSNEFKQWLKVITVGLPFAVCPITLYIAGQAKALQRNTNGIGFVAGMVIIEGFYILLLGALMAVCMSAARYEYVAGVTGILFLIALVTWGCCCYHPKCPRHCAVWSCCCHEIDEEEEEEKLNDIESG